MEGRGGMQIIVTGMEGDELSVTQLSTWQALGSRGVGGKRVDWGVP